MSLTCISCKVLFSDPELQREHYKSDWHRYNLKRKVAELPVITKEEYEEKVVACQLLSDNGAIKASSKCELCHKYFSTGNAMENHFKSKRHLEVQLMKQNGQLKTKKFASRGKKIVGLSGRTQACQIKADSVQLKEEVCEDLLDENEISEDDEDGWESVDEDEINDPTDCLFCCEIGDSLESNISHMSVAHSFFIPDIEYLTDPKGLVSYLHDKVMEGHLCLWCNDRGKAFMSFKAAQQHMLDKGHCKMLHEGESLMEYEPFYDYSSSYNDSTSENICDYVSVDVLDDSGYELVLPSGHVIGHRSLFMYYKQNLNPRNPGNENRIKKLIQNYRALGWTGTTGESAKRKAKDLKFVRNIRDKHFMKLGIKHNKFQPHFRQQVMF